jgi:hypothetical protein
MTSRGKTSKNDLNHLKGMKYIENVFVLHVTLKYTPAIIFTLVTSGVHSVKFISILHAKTNKNPLYFRRSTESIEFYN